MNIHDEKTIGHLITLPAEASRDDLRVVAAAILWDNTIYALPPPKRHHHVIHLIHESRQRWSDQEVEPLPYSAYEQGFLLNDGRFVSRLAAAALALRNGQVKTIAHPHHGLFSEDLW